jgi:hypothetical protein
MTGGSGRFPVEYWWEDQDLRERVFRLMNWIQYGKAVPGTYSLPGTKDEQEERFMVLATEAWKWEQGVTAPPTARAPAAPDWTCGCGATLHANEASCWRCGGKKT